MLGPRVEDRVSEHLYRNHSLPISFPRCHEPFSTELDRDSLVRSSERCEIGEPTDSAQGFNATQRDLLKSRRRGYKQMSEPQKWREVYFILFPDTRPNDVPSPYYEFKTTTDPGHPVDPLSEYEQFLQREHPDRVRQQLEIRIESALHPVEEVLRSQIVDIVRDTQLELFQSYMYSFAQNAGNPGQRVRPEGQEQLEQHPGTVRDQMIAEASNHQPLDPWPFDLEHEPQLYRPEPYFEGDFTGFDGLLFDFSQFQEQQTHIDSAYGSMPPDFTGDGKTPVQ
ncbi:hypothetical protein SLS62_008955 [Diatrype stigma]|uniref:Uncharacterized protein n=1 Tax=Diatrype stigma TaxID=117547 RepID=A0AAN9YM45_9PEZI